MDTAGREKILSATSKFKPRIDEVPVGKDVRDVTIHIGNKLIAERFLSSLKENDLIYDPESDPQPVSGPKLKFWGGIMTEGLFRMEFIDMASTELEDDDGGESH